MSSYVILEVFKKLLDSLVFYVVIESNIFCKVSKPLSNWTDTIPYEGLWIIFSSNTWDFNMFWCFKNKS